MGKQILKFHFGIPPFKWDSNVITILKLAFVHKAAEISFCKSMYVKVILGFFRNSNSARYAKSTVMGR